MSYVISVAGFAKKINSWYTGDMRKDYKIFNYTCLVLSGLFLLGSIWVWRSEARAIPQVEVEIASIPVVEKVAIPVVQPEPESVEKVVEEKPVLAKINLAVPFTSQAPEKDWQQPWQDACEEAAVLMLDAYYKGYNLSPLFAKDEILKMVAWEETQKWGTSIPMEKVQKLVEHFTDKTARIIAEPSISEIKDLLRAGQPVLVLAYGKDLPNPHFRGEGPDYHALIIRGFTDEKFITNDPGTQWGANFAYYYQDLMSAIHDWNGGEVISGQKLVLVIE